MKNIIFFLLLLSCSQLVSCKTKKIEVPKKIIEGSWVLKTISNNNTTIDRDLLLLDDVSLECFENSIWIFMPETNSGQYNINDMYCSFGKRKFSMLTQEVNTSNGLYEFIIRFTGKKTFNKEAKLKLIQLSDNSMQLQYSHIQNNTVTNLKMTFDKVKTNIVTTD